MKKISFIGGGTLGSTTAYTLGMKGLCDQIVIYDIAHELALHHAMDIGQALCKSGYATITAADSPEDIAGSDVVYIASSFPMAFGDKKYSVYGDFLTQLQETAEILRKYAPDSLIITLSNPVDIINTMLYKLSGKPARHFVGFSINDSVRLDMAIAARLGIEPRTVTSYCIGEHGMTKVPVLSHVKIGDDVRSFSDTEAEEIQNYTKDWWMSFLKLGINRTAGWSSASFSSLYVEQIVGRYTEPLEASVILSGQYGCEDISLGTPAVIDENGVKTIIELDLNEREKGLFRISKDAVKADIDRLIQMWQERENTDA